MLNGWRTAVANLLAFVSVIAMNAAANIVPINGQNTGQVSASYPSLFTPAGFTFAIWSLIYLALAGFAIYQALPGQRDHPLIKKITPWFLFSCVCNATWILAWHYEFIEVSLLLMLGLLVSLLAIFRKIEPWTGSTLGERCFIWFPFSIYAGWISVATIANISAVQTDWAANDLGMTAVNWTLLKLAVAGLAAAWVGLRMSNVPYVLVVAWAAYGISQRQVDTPAVAGAASMLVVVALGLALLALVSSRSKAVS